jgi:hypothetical protein
MYIGLNEGCDLVDNPMKRTLLALGLMKGDIVDDWVNVIHAWINAQNAPDDPNTNHVQVPSTDPIYWTHFVTEFNQAFEDSAEKQNAQTWLHSIHMEGRDLDSYLTKFHTLAAKAGYGLNKEGTLNLIRCGLPAELGKEIIRRENPQTWNEWERAAHNEHDVWLKLKSLYPSFTPKKEKSHFGRTEGEWHCTFKGKGHYTHPNNRTVPMNTSIDRINRTMTDDEKTRMMKEGRCFQCGNKGHMSKGCPTCSSNPPPTPPMPPPPTLAMSNVLGR